MLTLDEITKKFGPKAAEVGANFLGFAVGNVVVKQLGLTDNLAVNALGCVGGIVGAIALPKDMAWARTASTGLALYCGIRALNIISSEGGMNGLRGLFGFKLPTVELPESIKNGIRTITPQLGNPGADGYHEMVEISSGGANMELDGLEGGYYSNAAFD